MTQPASPIDGPVNLAAAPAVRLGALEVMPSTREVRHGDTRIIAEPRALQVLLALYQAAGAVVSRDDLLRRCWDGRIVGDDAINRSIAKARELAALSDPPAFVIETIPRVGYRLKVEAAAPVDAPVVAMVVPEEAGASAPETAPSRRLILFGGAGALAVAAIGGGALWWAQRPATPVALPLVAVLPFDNLSPDPQLGYFADGLAEDILDNLTRAGGLRVAARSSSFTFRGPQKAKAARTLGANYLLDGSVLRDGQRLRVNAYLSDAKSGQTLWSQTYDRAVGQELQIEDEVARQVAAALKVELTPHAARLIDPVVYDLYLQGREATRQHDPASIEKGKALLQQAVARAPDFTEAWFQLAKNRWHAGFLLPRPDQEASFALGRDAAQRVLTLDPRYGAAYGVLAQLTPSYHRWNEIEAGLVKGLALSPADADLILWRGDFLYRTGRVKASADALQRSWSLDPLDYANNEYLFNILIATRRFAEADTIARRIQAIWPQQVGAYWNTFWLLACSGREAEGAALLDDRARGTPSELPQEFSVLAAAVRASVSGSAAERQAAARQCIGLAQYGLGYAINAMLLLGKLGDDEAAAEMARAIYLQQGTIAIDRSVTFKGNSRYPPFGEASTENLFHPLVARVRQQGRFNAIFDGLGLTAFWQAFGPPDEA